MKNESYKEKSALKENGFFFDSTPHFRTLCINLSKTKKEIFRNIILTKAIILLG